MVAAGTLRMRKMFSLKCTSKSKRSFILVASPSLIFTCITLDACSEASYHTITDRHITTETDDQTRAVSKEDRGKGGGG